MELLDRIDYRGYGIKIFIDGDAESPLDDDQYAPMLVLHQRAERHFGWSTHKDWVETLEDALDAIRERGVTKTLYGPTGAMSIVNRWLRVAHGMRVVWPVSALEHSGTMVYLGNGEHWSDPGGWDSGWVGWWMVGPEQLAGWGFTDQAKIEESAKTSFDEFAAWVSGDVVGYQIVDPEGAVVESCFGIYGVDAFDENTGWAMTECKEIIDTQIAEFAAAAST